MLHGAAEVAVRGVVLQKVCEGLVVGQVVDLDNLELALEAVEDDAQGTAPDSSESVDADAGSHCQSLLKEFRFTYRNWKFPESSSSQPR